VLTDEALDTLRRHDWPGNVRELRNVILRALVTYDGGSLTPADLDLDPADGPSPWDLPRDGIDLPALARRLIVTAMERESGDVARAARLLHMSPPALRKRARKYGLWVRARRGGRS
jgi:DNA-binding NtrC family response regulator